MSSENIHTIIRDFSSKYKIIDWGYTDVSIPESFARYEQWVEDGYAGSLGYMTDHRKSLRKDIKSFFPEFQSALVFLFSYSTDKKWLENYYSTKQKPQKIAGYALGFEGFDYHLIIGKWLREIFNGISSELEPDVEVKYSLDIHPVLERDLAYRAGLGWFGKNSMLIHPRQGSYFMIGAVLLNQKISFEIKPPVKDFCGDCQRCIRACPTNAITSERTVVAKKCISNYTIELFNNPGYTPEGMESSGNRIFGCDICQEVCPWNQRNQKAIDIDGYIRTKKQASVLEMFDQEPELIQAGLNDMSNRQFAVYFKDTPIERTGKKGILKNLQVY